MHVISRKPFNEAMLMYPNHELALTELLNVLEKKTFTQPEEMKRYIPSLDNFKYRDKWWVIDVSGDAPRDKCAHFREINGIAAAFQYLQKNYNPTASSFL